MSRSLLLPAFLMPFAVACPPIFEPPNEPPPPPGLYDAGPDGGTAPDARVRRDAAIEPDAGEELDAAPTATTAWFPTEGPNGGWMRGLAADPRDTSKLYASSFMGGMWTSDDRGESWTRALLDPGSGIFAAVFAFDPQDPAIVYAAGVGLMRSTDGGRTWDRFSSLGDDQVYGLLIDPRDGRVLYAATEAGMFKSTNSGFDFDPINNGLPIATRAQALVIHPTDPDILYVGTGSGVYVSEDGGASWSAASRGIEDLGIVALAIDPLDALVLYAGTVIDGFYRSLDGGREWTPTSEAIGATSIAVDTALPGRVYAMTVGIGLIASRNHGDTWEPIDTGVSGTTRLSIAQGAPSAIYLVTESDGIHQSIDSGTSWRRINEGLVGAVVDFMALPASDTRILYAGTRQRVFKTATRGQRWSDPSVLPNLNDLAVEHGNAQIIYGACMNGIYLSDNGGLIWDHLDAGLQEIAAGVATDPHAPGTVYAGFSSGQLRKSTDYGETWEIADDGLFGSYAQSIVVDPISPLIVYAATDSGVFKSIDGAAHWSTAHGGLPAFVSTARELVIDPKEPNTLYVGSGFGIYKTIDGGEHWFDISPERIVVRALAISASDPSILLAGTGSGTLLKTIDGGETWFPAGDGLPENADVRDLLIDPQDPNLAYAAIGDRGVYKTIAGGE